MSQGLRNVMPSDEPDDTPMFSGRSKSSPPPPDKKPVKKGLIGKAVDRIRGDAGIARKQKRIEEIDQKAADDKAQLEREIVESKGLLADEVMKHDPARISEEKRLEAVFKSQRLQARRIYALIQVADKQIKREPCKDTEILSWIASNMQQCGLFGVFQRGGDE